MRPDTEYIKGKFREFNKLCFADTLPELPIRMSAGNRAMGVFIHPSRYPSVAPRGVGECHMRISNRYDLPERQIEDIILHEMIHYYIWYRRIEDTSAHGPAFRRIMNEINRNFGRNLHVSHRTSKEQLDSDRSHRLHIICLTEWIDGMKGFTPVARTRIFSIHRAFTSDSRVRKLKWIYTANPHFNRYPKALVPKAYRLTPEVEEELKEAIECYCDGNVIRPLGRIKK